MNKIFNYGYNKINDNICLSNIIICIKDNSSYLELNVYKKNYMYKTKIYNNTISGEELYNIFNGINGINGFNGFNGINGFNIEINDKDKEVFIINININDEKYEYKLYIDHDKTLDSYKNYTIRDNLITYTYTTCNLDYIRIRDDLRGCKFSD